MNQLARYRQLAESGEATFVRDAPPLFLARFRSATDEEAEPTGEANLDFGDVTTQVGTTASAETQRGELLELYGLAKKPKAPFAEMITIGRTENNDVAIRDAGVSRLHAYVTPRPSGWALADAGSRNGTILDGHPLEARREKQLKPGAVVILGGVSFLVLDAVETARLLLREG